MSIAQHLQHAWQQQATWLKCLRPLSCLYLWAFKLNRALYQRGLKKSYRPPVPVLVVGNITVGGSGKTPLLIALVRYLQQHHVRVGVISRGYGGKGPFPALVHLSSTPELVGDEPCLIVQSTQVPMAVGANRQQSIELLLQHHQLDLILSDDGLQHWALQRDIEWIVLDGQRGLGNERVLPEGFLREPKQRLQNATVIEHHHQASRALNMHLAVGQPYLLFPQQQHTTFDTQQSFHAVVGIGYPERFYRTLNELGIQQFERHSFADHHHYQWQDVQFGDQKPIIITEKDAVKLRLLLEHALQQQLIRPEQLVPIWIVPVQAVLSPQCYRTLAEQLAEHDVHLTTASI